MYIYIPSIDFKNIDHRGLFILTRPFWSAFSWINSDQEKERWGIPTSFLYTDNIAQAAIYFIPKPINTYTTSELKEINRICSEYKIKGIGYVSGDFGTDFGHFDALYFLRMGGFKSQLSDHNRGYPVLLSDQLKRLYQKTEIDLRTKGALPVVGFCGHASRGWSKKMKEKLKFIRENVQRFFKNPLRRDYEPLFSSAFERAQILRFLEQSEKVTSNFIYRENYRAGAFTEEARAQTTLQYYDNIKNSDYVVCVRGAGNFSVRFYETLMMGRIPIFINTNCLLPFEEEIAWKNHVVWVEWKDRKNVVQIVSDFHNATTNEEFINLQIKNRELWKETLSVRNILNLCLSNE